MFNLNQLWMNIWNNWSNITNLFSKYDDWNKLHERIEVCLILSGLNNFLRFMVKKIWDYFDVEIKFFTHPKRAGRKVWCMITFTVCTTFRLFTSFAFLANFCKMYTSNSAATGSISISITLTFKTTEEVKDKRSN